MSHETVPTALPQAETAFAAAGLSDREKDAARSVLAGMTAEQAASLMGVDASTVASYRQRAYAKLGLDGARELTERFGAPGEKGQLVDVPVKTYERLRTQGLNDTQARVLALVAEELTTAEIAEALTIARGTVNSARANGYRMLRIHSREELAELLAEPEETDVAETGEETPESEPPAAKKRHPLIMALICTAFALLALAEAWLAQTDHRDTPRSSTFYPSPNYPADVPFTAVAEDGTELFGVNESLQRFGCRNWVAAHMGGIADLFAAYGTEDELGYAYDNADKVDDSPLYAKDGTTVIGTFKCYVEQFYTTEQSRPDPNPETTPFTAYSAQDAKLFGRNKNGQCFGDRDFADRYLQGKLDLIAAKGRGGLRGYISELDVKQATSERAIEVPVYEKDGTTVIDALPLGYDYA